MRRPPRGVPKAEFASRHYYDVWLPLLSPSAELVAQAEIGRAQAEAARSVYAEEGVAEIEISTAADDKVCPVCDAA